MATRPARFDPFGEDAILAAVDTTGAGDSFDAGFLYGILQGWPLARTLRLACACGSLSTRAAGGAAGQATLPEALAALEEGSGAA